MAIVALYRASLTASQKGLLAGAMVVSLVGKIALAAQGHNFDVDSYRIVSDLLEQGQSVYANTPRYNYAPLWAWIVSGFGHLAGPEKGELFHMWISAFLGMVDILIAVAVTRAYSVTAAMVFLLSPIGLLISGFHAQFDNLAVLFGLSAWLLIRGGKPGRRELILSAMLLGVSLIAKHLLILFPLWLIFWEPMGKLRDRIVYAAIPYTMFAASFLPWVADPASRSGIHAYVLNYSSNIGFSWAGYWLDMARKLDFHPATSWFPFVGNPVWVSEIKLAWMVFMVVAGALIVRRGARELYLLYLLLLYASSPAVATQYEAIPLLAAAIFYTTPESWAFQISATLADVVSPTNAGIMLQGIILYLALPAITIGGRAYFMQEIQDAAFAILLTASQFCAGVLLVRQLRAKKEAPVRPRRVKFAVAGAFILLGAIPAAVRVARIVWAG